MKKLYGLVLFVLLSLIVSTQTVSADFGPKPTLMITVTGVGDAYVLDVLVPVDDDIDEIEITAWELDEFYHHDGYPAELIGFRDRDGYGSYYLYHGPGRISHPTDRVFEINYYAPSDIKIALVMEDSRAVIISDPIQTTHFDSRVVWNLDGVDLSHSSFGEGTLSGTIEGDITNSSTWYITGLNAIFRVILTIGIELFLLVVLFKVQRKRAWRDVAIVNAITQLILSVLVIQAYINGGLLLFVFLLFVLEALVWLVELIVYLKLLRHDLSGWKIFLYATLANGSSFLLSIFLAQFA